MRILCKVLFFLTVVSWTLQGSAGAGEYKKIRLASMSWDEATTESLMLTRQVLDGIIGKAFSHGGVEVEIRQMPWQRALRATAEGVFEGVAPVYYSREREQEFSYSMPFWSVNEVFVSLEDSGISYDGDIASLKGKTIGVVRGALPGIELETMGGQVETVDTFSQSIMMLFHRRVDVVLMPEEVYHIASESGEGYGVPGLQVLGDFGTYDVCVAISKKVAGASELVARFNQGLKKIIMDGTFDAVIAHHRKVTPKSS